MPLPEDSDSDESGNLLSFSAAFEASRTGPKSSSQALSLSPQSDPKTMALNTLSTDSAPEGSRQPVIEDALRARAEQAESAAERLLELVEPEEQGAHHSTFPTSLLAGSHDTSPPPKPKPAPIPMPNSQTAPVTPMTRSAAILRQAAMFQDSPARNGSQSSLLDVLKDGRHATGWQSKRMASEFFLIACQ
jgi:CLIP-associating protein 1/2